MRHVCKALSLDVINEAFNSRTVDIAFIDMTEICYESTSSCNDSVFEYCYLLVFRKLGMTLDCGLCGSILGACSFKGLVSRTYAMPGVPPVVLSLTLGDPSLVTKFVVGSGRPCLTAIIAFCRSIH